MATREFATFLVTHELDALPTLLSAVQLGAGFRLKDARRIADLQQVCRATLGAQRGGGGVPRADRKRRDGTLRLINPASVEIPAAAATALPLDQPAAFCATSLSVASYVVSASAARRPVLGRVAAGNTGEDFSLYVRLDRG